MKSISYDLMKKNRRSQSCDKVQLDRVLLKMLAFNLYFEGFLNPGYKKWQIVTWHNAPEGLLFSTFDKSTSVKIVKFDSVKIIKFVKKSSQFVIYHWWTSSLLILGWIRVSLHYLHDKQTRGHSKACFWCKIIWNHHSHSDSGHFVFCSVFHSSYFINGCNGFSIWTIDINFDA